MVPRAHQCQRVLIRGIYLALFASVLFFALHFLPFQPALSDHVLLPVDAVKPEQLVEPVPQDAVPIPPGRENDYKDIWTSFLGRKQCKFGALDLHKPSDRLCQDQRALLDAVTDGSRPGFNEPFEPRGCDMHFYRTEEICKILSRFEGVIFFGDSMVRHLEGALTMLLRENYYDGGQGHWKDWKQDGGYHCTCEEQTYSMACIFGETNVQDVYENADPLIKCPAESRPNVHYRDALTWPLPQPDFDKKIAEVTSMTRPIKPYAFILGHAGWNQVNATATIKWTDQVLERLGAVRPYLAQDQPFSYPMAFVSITASGPLKPSMFLGEQGNEAVIKFETAVRGPIQDRGIDFLGPYNMSRNARIPDGTHSGIRVNLLKAMTLVNWLDMVDIDAWTESAP